MVFKECLPPNYWDKLKKYFVHNSSAVQPEVLLYCAYVSDKTPNEEKSRALLWIIEARKRERQNPVRQDTVRIFQYPKEEQINLNADSIMDLLDWDSLPYFYIIILNND